MKICYNSSEDSFILLSFLFQAKKEGKKVFFRIGYFILMTALVVIGFIRDYTELLIVMIGFMGIAGLLLELLQALSVINNNLNEINDKLKTDIKQLTQ